MLRAILVGLWVFLLGILAIVFAVTDGTHQYSGVCLGLAAVVAAI
jgi:hypothetical protein